MIVSMLVDLNDDGDFYRLTIETEDKARLFRTLSQYSRDVRDIEDKDEPGRKDVGKRRLPDGSTILNCKFFGSKIGYIMRFETSRYKLETIQKAVMV